MNLTKSLLDKFLTGHLNNIISVINAAGCVVYIDLYVKDLEIPAAYAGNVQNDLLILNVSPGTVGDLTVVNCQVTIPTRKNNIHVPVTIPFENILSVRDQQMGMRIHPGVQIEMLSPLVDDITPARPKFGVIDGGVTTPKEKE